MTTCQRVGRQQTQNMISFPKEIMTRERCHNHQLWQEKGAIIKKLFLVCLFLMNSNFIEFIVLHKATKFGKLSAMEISRQVVQRSWLIHSIILYKYDQKLCDQSNYQLEGSLVAKFLNGIVCMVRHFQRLQQCSVKMKKIDNSSYILFLDFVDGC